MTMSLLVTALKGKISQMKLVEDFESRPHKAVSFLVERGKERQDMWNEQKLPKAPPEHSEATRKKHGREWWRGRRRMRKKHKSRRNMR